MIEFRGAGKVGTCSRRGSCKTAMATLQSKLRIGPKDHGRRMSLKRFEPAAVEETHIYELARGIIVVSEVPGFSHFRQVEAIRDPMTAFKLANPDRVYAILGTMECKLLVWDFESERHPDLAIYTIPPPIRKGRKMWTRWIPALVVEVVSPGSVDRDYVEKREEYWNLGVKEYWIVDAERGQVLHLRRGRSQWIEKTLKRGDVLESKLLPGFRLPCAEVFDAAGPLEAD